MKKQTQSFHLGPLSITIILWIVGAIIVVAAWLFLCPMNQDLISSFFDEKLRNPLFSGLLSLTGFLFALKAFILTNMKTSLYDRPAYEQIYRASVEEFKKDSGDTLLPSHMKRYAGLDELRGLLEFTLTVCLIAAIVQLSLGLVNHWIASLVCITIAVNAIALLGLSVRCMQLNMKDLVTYWNSEYEMTPAERSNLDPHGPDAVEKPDDGMG
jgi:uncharacterized membrane protein (DUF485 family)